MTLFTSVFHPYASTLSNADAEGQDSAGANDPTLTFHNLGFVNKSAGKSSHLAVYNARFPFSGPKIPEHGRILVTKAKIEYTIAQGLIVDATFAYHRLGILAYDGFWTVLNQGFDPTFYPAKDDLPRPSTDADVIRPGTLFNEQFLSRIDETIDFPVFASTHSSPYTQIIYGRGYGNTLHAPYNELYGNSFINFASELTEYFRAPAWVDPANSLLRPSFGIALDTAQNPAAAHEYLQLRTSDDSGDPGMVCTIEWSDMKSNIRAGKRSGARVAATGKTGQRVTAEQEARQRIFAANLAGQRIAVERQKAGPRITIKSKSATSGD